MTLSSHAGKQRFAFIKSVLIEFEETKELQTKQNKSIEISENQ